MDRFIKNFIVLEYLETQRRRAHRELASFKLQLDAGALEAFRYGLRTAVEAAVIIDICATVDRLTADYMQECLHYGYDGAQFADRVRRFAQDKLSSLAIAAPERCGSAAGGTHERQLREWANVLRVAS